MKLFIILNIMTISFGSWLPNRVPPMQPSTSIFGTIHPSQDYPSLWNKSPKSDIREPYNIIINPGAIMKVLSGVIPPSKNFLHKIDKFSPKFLNPLMLFKKKTNKIFKTRRNSSDSEIKKLINSTCMYKNGTLINEECYQFIPRQLSFGEAQQFCMLNGGHLWTPDFNDIHLFDKLRLQLRESIGAVNNSIWIGATSSFGSITDVNGNDVTNTLFFMIENVEAAAARDGCAVFDFNTGAPVYVNGNCTTGRYNFICEYPIVPDPVAPANVIFKKSPYFPLIFFKSAW